MMFFAIGLGAVFLIALAPTFVWASLFNRLVRRRNRVEQIYGTLDAQLVQRHARVPRLVDAVAPHAAEERELLDEVIRRRGVAAAAAAGAAVDGAPGGADREARLRMEMALSDALSRLRRALTAYPGLLADEQLLGLRRAVDEVELNIAGARRAYDSAVTAYNDAVRTFPGSLVARVAGFRARPVFAGGEDQRADADARVLLTPA